MIRCETSTIVFESVINLTPDYLSHFLSEILINTLKLRNATKEDKEGAFLGLRLS